jgi:hypothetical protein
MRAVIFIALTIVASGATFEDSAHGFLKKHCVACHAGNTPAGKVNLAQYVDERSVKSDLRSWSKILNVVAAESMPPPMMKKPPSADRERFTTYVQSLLERPGTKPRSGKAPNRRMTRLEYNNTIRDTLELPYDILAFPERLPYTKSYFKPAADRMPRMVDVETVEYGQPMPVLLRDSSLPGESRAEYGFSNHTDNLNTTPLLLERYLSLAQEISDHPRLERDSLPFRRLLQSPSRQLLRARFQEFLCAAFRRPVDAPETERFLKLYDQLTSTGASHEKGIRALLRAVFSSPSFLLRSERAPQQERIDDHALASRLSYFLWASAPDAELRELASANQLQDPAILSAQVRRMLRDPKVRELSDTFAVQWLQLNEMFGAQPDVDLFKHYYIFDAFGTNKGNLAQDMLAEALLLFETILIENRPITDMIHVPFTYANTRLMKHYQIDALYTKEFKESSNYGVRKGPSRFYRIDLKDENRGGILTMGATLTMNSSPRRTSPVFRGAWILEAIFNRPPPPPPAAVPTLESAAADQTNLSIRQRLAEHRKNPACSSCHNRMDPMGLALENFDAVGVWRNTDGKEAIDASGALSHERKFSNAAEFKRAILDRKEDFVRAFIEHLLSYALNRKLDYFDAPVVADILERSRPNNYRFVEIVEAVAQSFPFQHSNEYEPQRTANR